MNGVRHQDLADGRWWELSLAEQLGHVGSEVSRAIRWRSRRPDRAQEAPVSSAAACPAAARARSASNGSGALLIGCSMTTKRWPSAPSTRAISRAALTNCVVITPTEGTPARSPATASCKLHDEQLPQSPTPAISASQPAA